MPVANGPKQVENLWEFLSKRNKRKMNDKDVDKVGQSIEIWPPT